MGSLGLHDVMLEGLSGTAGALVVELPVEAVEMTAEGGVDAIVVDTELAPDPARSQGLGGALATDISIGGTTEYFIRVNFQNGSRVQGGVSC